MKEWQEQYWVLEKMFKVVESATVQTEVLPTVGDSSVVVVDDERKDEDLGPHIGKGRRSLQATADFASSSQDAGVRPFKAVVDQKGQTNNDACDTRALSVEGEGGQLNELREYM